LTLVHVLFTANQLLYFPEYIYSRSRPLIRLH